METPETPGTSMETIDNSRKRKAEETERRTKRLKLIEERERNLFDYVPDEDTVHAPFDYYMELQIYNKMYAVVLQDMKKQFEVPFVRDRLLKIMKSLTVEEFAKRELEFYMDSLQHPGILSYKYLQNGKFSVYQGRPRRNWFPECINGTFEVDETTLADPPPEDPLDEYDF